MLPLSFLLAFLSGMRSAGRKRQKLFFKAYDDSHLDGRLCGQSADIAPAVQHSELQSLGGCISQALCTGHHVRVIRIACLLQMSKSFESGTNT